MAHHLSKEVKSAGEGKPPAAQRTTINGHSLRAAAEEQAAADATKPVAINASLRDLVIAFADMILARREAKWTDAEISAWLSELGFEIGPDTLRTYRSQLQIGVKASASPPKRRSVSSEPILSIDARRARDGDNHETPGQEQGPPIEAAIVTPSRTAVPIVAPLSTSTARQPLGGVTNDELDAGV